jgi:hypothetical protein
MHAPENRLYSSASEIKLLLLTDDKADTDDTRVVKFDIFSRNLQSKT